MLAAGRRAALHWADLIETSGELTLYQPPELDIVSYFPATDPLSLSRIDAGLGAAYWTPAWTAVDDPVFLSTLKVSAAAPWRPGIRTSSADVESGRILRSVLMKPEHEAYVDHLHQRVCDLARA